MASSVTIGIRQCAARISVPRFLVLVVLGAGCALAFPDRPGSALEPLAWEPTLYRQVSEKLDLAAWTQAETEWRAAAPAIADGVEDNSVDRYVDDNIDDGAASPASAAETSSFYVQPRSYGTRRDTEPPRYVRELSQINLPLFQEADWLLFNTDYRMRYEARQNDFRLPDQESDFPFMLRTRAFLGVKEKFDPLRLGFEFEDARRDHSDVPPNTRDDNYNELIQGYAELYFEDGIGQDRPLRVQYGRMAFEYLDRRLIARNDWRNTTNTFQGFRTILGKQENDWQLDLLALQPLRRIIEKPDHPEKGTWFYGVIGDWRRWSEVITLQPYYLLLNRHLEEEAEDRNIHTLALRGYGIVGDTGYDFDFDVAYQFGEDRDKRVTAFGCTTELGYTWEDNEMKPRASLFAGYGSGDRDPFDDVDQRFDRLYGFARPWSASDYFIWENIIALKPRFEFQAGKKLQVDMGYSAYWLASDRDIWANAELWDPLGLSGDFCGQELDIRFRAAATSHLDLAVGFAYFVPGDFPINLGKNKPSSFVYVELAPRLIK